MTTMQKRRDDKIALRTRLLAELAGKPRTTTQLAATLDLEWQQTYVAMQSLEKDGLVEGFNDRRSTVLGVTGRVWSLIGEARPVEPPPARDPLLWALFGQSMEAA